MNIEHIQKDPDHNIVEQNFKIATSAPIGNWKRKATFVGTQCSEEFDFFFSWPSPFYILDFFFWSMNLENWSKVSHIDSRWTTETSTIMQCVYTILYAEKRNATTTLLLCLNGSFGWHWNKGCIRSFFSLLTHCSTWREKHNIVVGFYVFIRRFNWFALLPYLPVIFQIRFYRISSQNISPKSIWKCSSKLTKSTQDMSSRWVDPTHSRLKMEK